MNRLFKNYTLAVLWILMLSLDIWFLRGFGKSIIYGYLGISAIFIGFFLLQHPNILLKKVFLIFLIFNGLNIMYFLLFSQTLDSFMYLVAKFILFSIIIINIYYNYDYYLNDFPNLIVKIGFIVLLIGLLVNYGLISGRYTGPFNNANSLGWFSALLFGIVLLRKQIGVKELLLLAFFLGLTLLSGSRTGMGGLAIAVLLRGSFRIKNIAIILIAGFILFSIQNISEKYDINTGLDRLFYSDEALFADRTSEFDLGVQTVLESPLIGNGLDKYAYISPSVVAANGLAGDKWFIPNPHNSFVALFVMYGIPIGLFIFIFLVYYVSRIVQKRMDNKIWLFILLFSFSGGMFESYLFSINASEGILFWMALPISLIYSQKKNMKNKKE